jgi:O-6-methylguanine DNA methyltransferase
MKTTPAARSTVREEVYHTLWGDGRLVCDGDLPFELELPGGMAAPAAAPANGAAPSRWRSFLERYFAGEPVTFPLDAATFAAAHGCTRFETSVYAALAAVGYGEVLSYRDLAVRAGHPNAYRAVGSAMARNPLPVILPCHRVIKNDGHAGPYGDDPAWKLRLLALEGRRVTRDGKVQP